MIDDAVAVVEALHHPDLRSVGRGDQPVPAYPTLVREPHEVLGEVQQRDRVEIGAQAQHETAMVDQPLKRRARAVIVVPGNVGGERRCEPSGRDEAALGMVARNRARTAPEHLGKRPVVRIRRRAARIEGLGPGQQRRPLVLWLFVHPRRVVARAHHHEHRPSRADDRLDRVEQAASAAVDGADGAQRCVHHHQVAGTEPEALQIVREPIDQPWLTHRGGFRL